MIAIINYGFGNLNSIKNMLKQVGFDSVITDEASIIENADKLILPGVGRFDDAVVSLEERGLDRLILDEANRRKPILGICLGMQLLGNRSEEGVRDGLGLIDFETVRFSFTNGCDSLKVPHMGWERVSYTDSLCPLNSGIEENQRYYFVHSYHAVCRREENIMAYCSYGYEFAAGVRQNNIYGVQYHPEKSHKYGMRILENFARNC